VLREISRSGLGRLCRVRLAGLDWESCAALLHFGGQALAGHTTPCGEQHLVHLSSWAESAFACSIMV
jgi:hypothetical protein